MKFIWHGGEPMLMGTSFYKEAILMQQKLLSKIYVLNNIQTNGTLINKEWCDFFQQNRFGIGISLDGDSVLNSDRIYPSGTPAIDKILEGQRLLAKNHVKHGILAVIDEKLYGHEQAFYDFIKKLGCNLKVNIKIPYGLGKENVHVQTRESLDAIGNAYIQLYNIWKNDIPKKNPFVISPFKEFITAFITGEVSECCFSQTGCSHHICVGHDGRIFSCGRFSSDADYEIGNIFEMSLKEVEQHEKYLLKEQRIKFIEEKCGNCRYLKLCYGGCPQVAVAWYGNFMEKSPYCDIYRALFKQIESDLNLSHTQELIKI